MRLTIEQACRELGLAQPKRVGGQMPPETLKRLFKDAPKGVHLWITDAFHEIIERIPPEQCFRFWKSNVRQRLLEDGLFVREAWPGNYAYLAQQWESPFKEPLIQLMRCD